MARFSFRKCYFGTYILLSGSKNVTLLPVVRGCVVLPIPSAVTHISAAALGLRTHVFGISQCPPPRTPTFNCSLPRNPFWLFHSDELPVFDGDESGRYRRFFRRLRCIRLFTTDVQLSRLDAARRRWPRSSQLSWLNLRQHDGLLLAFCPRCDVLSSRHDAAESADGDKSALDHAWLINCCRCRSAASLRPHASTPSCSFFGSTRRRECALVGNGQLTQINTHTTTQIYFPALKKQTDTHLLVKIL